MTTPQPNDEALPAEEIEQAIQTAIDEAKNTTKSDNPVTHILWLVQGLDLWHRTNGKMGHSLDEVVRYVASSVIRDKEAAVLAGKLEALTELDNLMVGVPTGIAFTNILHNLMKTLQAQQAKLTGDGHE